jgi:hypothetical protein
MTSMQAQRPDFSADKMPELKAKLANILWEEFSLVNGMNGDEK